MSTNALNSLAEATGLYHRQTTEALNRLTEQIQQLIQSSQVSFEQQVQVARNLEAAGNRMERGIDKLADAVNNLRHEMENHRAEADKFRALIERQITAAEKKAEADDRKTEAFMQFCNRQLEVMADALQVAKQSSPAA